jgi:hypothetical protein
MVNVTGLDGLRLEIPDGKDIAETSGVMHVMDVVVKIECID